MKKSIKPSKIRGIVEAPASKSFSQRAIAAALLAEGESTLHSYTPCNDSEAALRIAGNLGAKVIKEGNLLKIKGGIHPKSDSLSCGESGLGIRMFSPIIALLDKKITVDGDGSLTKRPVHIIEDALKQFGAQCITKNGFLPIEITGPLQGGDAAIDGKLSSQVITGLLMALPLASNNSSLHVRDLTSKPYIDITIQLLKDFGISIEHDNYVTFRISGNQRYSSINYSIEGDWSGAAFHLVAGALGGEVEVRNLNPNSLQADRKILKALQDVGAEVHVNEHSVIAKQNGLQSFAFDATDCPDLFPPLVALAIHCKGITELNGVSRLKHKESNRASVLKMEFEKIGARIEIEGDVMKIHGGSEISGGELHSNNDHRIAMAGAVAAIRSKKPIVIENTESIDKSYPAFFEDFEKIIHNK